MGSERIDRDVFSQILKVLAAAYPSFDGLDRENIMAYYAILGDLPREVLKAATVQYASEHKWFPTAAELRSTAFDLIDQAQGRITAEQAWGLVMKAASRVGHRREPEFPDPLVWEAIEDVGGWRHICLGPDQMIHTTRARFIDAFKSRQKRERVERAMLPQVREAARLLAADRPRLEDKGA